MMQVAEDELCLSAESVHHSATGETSLTTVLSTTTFTTKHAQNVVLVLKWENTSENNYLKW